LPGRLPAGDSRRIGRRWYAKIPPGGGISAFSVRKEEYGADAPAVSVWLRLEEREEEPPGLDRFVD
jgi:hypothetical protein